MAASDAPLVSVVMPCLDEAETVAACVREALAGLAGLDGEVIVADNGSTDGSRELATAAGARVVPVSEKGYGAALMGGIAASRGTYVVMGDADLSYDFSAVPRFVEELEKGHDLVMGSRFRGRIEKGAMPVLHRYLGNPVLTGLGRLFFRIPVSDFHCGLRGFRRDAVPRMGLRTTGMEFASEMVVKAALFGLSMSEIPVTLRKDGRSRPPHLRTWRDGWRHLRFLLLYSPRWLFLLPGLLLALLGAALMAWVFFRPQIVLGVRFDIHTMLGGAGLVLVGVQAMLFAIFAKTFAITEGLLPEDPKLTRLYRVISLETGLLVSLVAVLTGLAFVLSVLLRWRAGGFQDLPVTETMRLMIPGVLFLSLGAQGLFASFLLSLLGLSRKG